MSDFITTLPYVSPNQRELRERSKKCLSLRPWTVQNIIYELIVNHFLTNNPADMGYAFAQRYSPNKTQSQIAIDLSYNWKADVASKRPAIFVMRGDANYKYPTMHQGIGKNVADSQDSRFGLVTMPVNVIIVAGPLGLAEELADFVKYPFISYAQEIQKDFCISQLRLTSIGKPQIVVEGKENFSIELSLQIAFGDNWTITGDHLKLKTMSLTIFDSVTQQPLENQ